jgi:hypothetical protein
MTTLLAKTITRKPIVFIARSADSVQFSFRDGGRPATATLETRYGPMDFYLGQIRDAVESPDGRTIELRTTQYRYTLQPHGMDDSLFRWEYVRLPAEGATYCRHHLQGSIPISFTDSSGAAHTTTLDAWHLPTGWLAVEEVLRFCIVDLGVEPLAEDWDQVLADSHQRFQPDLTG